MTNTQVVTEILTTVQSMVVFLLPVIGIISGLTFIFSFLMYATVGSMRRAGGGRQ